MYVHVLNSDSRLLEARRFVYSYAKHPPGYPHDTIIACNCGSPTEETKGLFKPLPKVSFLEHDNSGYDIGAFQHASRECGTNIHCLLWVIILPERHRLAGSNGGRVYSARRSAIRSYGPPGQSTNPSLPPHPHHSLLDAAASLQLLPGGKEPTSVTHSSTARTVSLPGPRDAGLTLGSLPGKKSCHPNRGRATRTPAPCATVIHCWRATMFAKDIYHQNEHTPKNHQAGKLAAVPQSSGPMKPEDHRGCPWFHLELNSRCNLHCALCFPGNSQGYVCPHGEMPLSFVERLYRQNPDRASAPHHPLLRELGAVPLSLAAGNNQERQPEGVSI